ncbi:hypothetical protein F7725_008149 [Dissostichus mawsoni]|uniref:Leucine zipper protein 1 n=1 Tax=Dissostichus mawsoni TaxID=36200 RepID=A0A7J5Y6B3_DISMA|nr:hypothetical protein F7725_008149 [Dissostichus mawsoni]
MSDHKDMTHRHLRHKLQSLGRRLDELEEATNKLQKAEEELLDLQGKDEEVRKAEDLCRTVREKLEEEESLTQELKAEIERLQRRMADLEKLEEAFGKCKSDCSQLCLSLNEEKNLTKKLSSELEALKARLKEVEGLLTSKLAGRKKSLEYLKLADDNIGLKSENEKNSGLEQDEDNKVKELTQEVERLKNRLKQLEIVEGDLKDSESKNGELNEKFQMERNRARQLSEQVEQLMAQLGGKGGTGRNGTSNVDKHGNGSTNICPAKVLENGKAENEEIIVKGGFSKRSRNIGVPLLSQSQVPLNTGSGISPLRKDTASASDQESTDQVQESVSVSVAGTLSKANGSYSAYRSHVTPLLSNDQGSEVIHLPPKQNLLVQGHLNPSLNSFDEELHRSLFPEVGQLGPAHTTSGIEIQQVCSPREALRSKAVIKPAIVEIDRKEVMISEPLSANGKPKISTKPMVTTTSKMTSSITIYPNDPSSSRTSSRSSSVSSEHMPIKERHTSTSNIVIGPSIEHHGSISVPYEISIPKSDITLQTCQEDQDYGMDDLRDSSFRSKHHNRVETTTSHLSRQHSNFSLQSPDITSADFNDTESGFESSSSTTVTSWRHQRQNQHSLEEPESKNVTVRSTWKNRSPASVEETGQGRGGARTMADGGLEDETETATTWRAYRATTFDIEESMNSGAGAGGNAEAQKGFKPTPAEVYMRRINSVTANPREVDESVLRRGKSSESPTMEARGLGRTVPHTPVIAQSWGRSYTQQPQAADSTEPSPIPGNSPASWRRQMPSSDSPHLGSSYDRASKTAGASSRGDLWSSLGQGIVH